MGRTGLPTSLLRASAVVGVPGAVVLAAWGTGSLGALGLYAPMTEYSADAAPAGPVAAGTRTASTSAHVSPSGSTATDTAALPDAPSGVVRRVATARHVTTGDTTPNVTTENATTENAAGHTVGRVTPRPSVMSFGERAPAPVVTPIRQLAATPAHAPVPAHAPAHATAPTTAAERSAAPASSAAPRAAYAPSSGSRTSSATTDDGSPSGSLLAVGRVSVLTFG